ncbi:hypothetical protein PPS11_01904 [Pseudomonas putida S11]|nr:hypothetical protein PPS11_01904 [Pseudomonas putida S11]
MTSLLQITAVTSGCSKANATKGALSKLNRVATFALVLEVLAFLLVLTQGVDVCLVASLLAVIALHWPSQHREIPVS